MAFKQIVPATDTLIITGILVRLEFLVKRPLARDASPREVRK